MTETSEAERRIEPDGPVRRIVAGWALAGGAMLLVTVTMNVLSVAGGVFWKPFPGDFELTEIGVAIAAFSFLPYCQLTGANVTADIFTTNASRKTLAFFSLFASVVALGFSLLLAHRMYFGMLDQKVYGYTTAILQVPHWLAYIPILISLLLLAVAAALTLYDTIRCLGKD